MHEMAIAEAVLEIVRSHADGRRVERLDVKIGHLRQVVPSAFEFAFQLAAAGTNVEGAELVIEAVPAAVRCRACGADTRIDWFPLRCARCGGLDTDVVSGEELLVESLDVVNEPQEDARWRPVPT